jgi:uncharacterized membrane protein YcaP (DUF421 family)
MDIVIRAAVIYLLVFLVTRVIGKRELSSLEPFDVILLVVIGDLVQQGVTQSDYSLTGGILAILTISVLTVATTYLNFRLRRLRPLLEGEPIVLIERGNLIDDNLRRERLTHEELESEARQPSIASLDDVQWAVLETNGKVSFLQG